MCVSAVAPLFPPASPTMAKKRAKKSSSKVKPSNLRWLTTQNYDIRWNIDLLSRLKNFQFLPLGPYGVEAFIVVSSAGLANKLELRKKSSGPEVFPASLSLALNSAGYGAVPGSLLQAYRQWHLATKPTAADLPAFASALLTAAPGFDIDPTTPLPPGHEWRGSVWVKPTASSNLYFAPVCFELLYNGSACQFTSSVQKPTNPATNQTAAVNFYVMVQSLHP